MSVKITPTELIEETRLLETLTELLIQGRVSRPDRPPLADVLDQQAQLCDELAKRRADRAARLQANGYGPRDLLVALLAATPKHEQKSAVATFSAYVQAAEQAQAQIDINREFFSVALSAVEDALAAAVPDSRPVTYDALGSKRRAGGSAIVSTST